MPTCAVCKTKFYHQTNMDQAEPCDCGECFEVRPDVPMTEADLIRLAKANSEWIGKQASQFISERLTQATMVIIATVMALPKEDRPDAIEAAVTILRKALALAEKLETAVEGPNRPQ